MDFNTALLLFWELVLGAVVGFDIIFDTLMTSCVAVVVDGYVLCCVVCVCVCSQKGSMWR